MDKSVPFIDGWLAHKNNLGENANPYSPTASAYSYDQWLLGWVSRYDAVKHDLEMEFDSYV